MTRSIRARKLPASLEKDGLILADYYKSVSRLDHGVGLVLAQLKKSGRENDTLVIYVSDNGIPSPGGKTDLYDSGIHLPLIVRAPGGRAGATTDAMASWIDVAPRNCVSSVETEGTERTGRSRSPRRYTEVRSIRHRTR